MRRREFLLSTAAAAGVASLPTAWAAESTQAAQTPLSVAKKNDLAKIKKSTLDRIAIMTLNFQRILKVPDVQDSPERTLELFDIGEMLADTYGTHKVEFQHYHLASTETSHAEIAARQPRKGQIARDADQPGVLGPEHLCAAESRSRRWPSI